MGAPASCCRAVQGQRDICVSQPVLQQGLAAAGAAGGSWQLEGREARSSAAGLSAAPSAAKPGPGSAAPGAPRGRCHTGSGPLPSPRTASCEQDRRCWRLPRGPPAPLTAFLPCPLQRRRGERRRAGALAAHRRRARAEGETPASPRSQRDPPLRQQVTRSLPRAFLVRPAPRPPRSAQTARGTPRGGRPTLPALGHLGTV